MQPIAFVSQQNDRISLVQRSCSDFQVLQANASRLAVAMGAPSGQNPRCWQHHCFLSMVHFSQSALASSQL
jgi:hypothetical protein